MGERDTSAMEGDEIWFVLAGVKSPEDPILRSTLIETLLQGLHGKVKGVVVKLTEGDEVREEVLRGMRRGLAGVKEGDIKIL